MPAFSIAELYMKLHNDGKATVHGVEVTESLLQELKDNEQKAEGFTSSVGVVFTQQSAKDILALFEIDPFATGVATAKQWREKLTSMYQTLKPLSEKSILDLEEAKEAYDIYKDASTYFLNFDQQVPDVIEKSFKNNISIDVYKEFFNLGMQIAELYGKMETAAKEMTKREGEVKSLEIFAQQFEKITHKNDISPAIQTQYDSYLGWIEKYFPSVVAKIGTVGENYFKDIDLGVFQDWSNRVTSAYDTLRIIHNRLNSTI